MTQAEEIRVAMPEQKRFQPDAMRENIAHALDASPRHISIERSSFSPGLRSVRCWGRSLGKRFFAKTLLQDPYPVMPRVAIPWCEGTAREITFRPAEEQIEAEWTTAQSLRKLAGPDNVPMPLGKSLTTQTTVWQDAGGSRLDDLVKRPRLLDSRASGLNSALFRAAAWLRKVHDKSAADHETLNLGEILQQLRKQIDGDKQHGTRHGDSALRVLEQAFLHAGAYLRVPRVLSHGDLMLANLRWNKADDRLFVVDFENFGTAHQCQDLISLVFDLRSQLLNPLISKRLILSLEESFWAGYGQVAAEVRAFVQGVASARVLYYHLPQALQKRSQKGGLAGATASVYKTFFEPAMLARCREA